jgi:hypothetical protein
VDTTATLSVRRRVQDYGAWRAEYETLDGLHERPGCSSAVAEPPPIEIAVEA